MLCNLHVTGKDLPSRWKLVQKCLKTLNALTQEISSFQFI